VLLIEVYKKTRKPIWACTSCGMFSSRKYSVNRHIQNIHEGGANIVSYTDYIIGRRSAIYLPGIAPTYIPKNKDSGPHYMDILKDELFRCTIRKSFESSQNKK
jgi:hypothetical protein